MNKFKAVTLLLLVFLAGIAVGVVGTRAAVRYMIRTAIERPDNVRLGMERRLTRQLALDATQQTRVHDILVNAQDQMRGLRREIRPQLVQIVGGANREITALLTPEQRLQFEKLKARNPVFWRAGERAAENPPADADSH